MILKALELNSKQIKVMKTMTQELNNQMALHWKLLKQIYELNKRKAFYKESRDRYNTKSFFELPHEEELQEAFKNQVRSNTDTFKDWYSVSTMTFMSIDPIVTKDYIKTNPILTKVDQSRDGLVYFKGEVNDKHRPHGAGIKIVPFKYILEAYFDDGEVCGQEKILWYANYFGEIRFTKFKKHTWNSLTGFNGFYQTLTQDGDIIREGYEKGHRIVAETRMHHDSCKIFGKSQALGPEQWY